jgi:hypothetical protein
VHDVPGAGHAYGGRMFQSFHRDFESMVETDPRWGSPRWPSP